MNSIEAAKIAKEADKDIAEQEEILVSLFEKISAKMDTINSLLTQIKNSYR